MHILVQFNGLNGNSKLFNVISTMHPHIFYSHLCFLPFTRFLFDLSLSFHCHFNCFLLLLYTFWCRCVCSLSQMEILMDDGTFQSMEIDYWIRNLNSILNGCRWMKSILFREMIYQFLRKLILPYFCVQTQTKAYIIKCYSQAKDDQQQKNESAKEHQNQTTQRVFLAKFSSTRLIAKLVTIY